MGAPAAAADRQANGHDAAIALAKRRIAAASPAPAADQPAETFLAADLVVERRAELQPKPELEGLRFGVHFSDHQLVVEHVVGEGWGAPRIIPFGPLAVHPAAQVLHYGMSCFEGMKVYKGGPGGRPRLFRPELNMARFRSSARRLGLADFDPQELLACLRALLRLDAAWVPDRPGYSLYIRPFAWASSFSLGVGPPTRTTISVVCSPVGPYWPSGLQPISLFVDEQHVRAWPGGCGASKVAPNYGPTIVPHMKAAASHGTHMVLYTLPHGIDPEAATVSEAGAMNVFFLLDKADGGGLELATPPLDGTILPGVHRASILELARGWGEFAVSERPLTIGELSQAAGAGRLREAFGCGTACLVQPVQELVRAAGPPLGMRPLAAGGSLAARLHTALQDIQYGRVASPWSVPV